MPDGSLSQFKATLARKSERNQKRQARTDRHGSNYKSSVSKPEFDFPQLSETEMDQVKTEIREKIKSDKKREQTTILIILVFLISVVLFLMF